MGLNEAAEWAGCVQEAGAEHWSAVCAWVRSGAYVAEGTGEVPSVSDFEERFCGHWDSFVEYTDQLAEDTGLMKGWSAEAIKYFDWASWKNDLSYDYTVMDAPSDQGYGVYIIQNR
ncbi:Antirestriction protein (ArdA) [Actinomyces ruminicola]|uniref:Antirestriction protein (ArdA) n=1 Tax=Actinomyces ruminicola TaxID=332524 RepID=A0A1H0DEY8_9ACTO|nr:antirestriction protein ArdA [Actinomyces ruminicola]SDN68551.1 Antirestriction protein (ArdA) [Actinomyces ruminicola]